jgi:hypothetical protein
MRIKKENKMEVEQLALVEGKKVLRQAQDKKKNVRDEGPKWVSAALLLMTVLLSLYFWVQGTGGISKVTEGILNWTKNWRSEKVYVIE